MDRIRVSGSNTTSTIPLQGDHLVIGRSPESEVAIPDDPRVSRVHAVLHHFPTGWTIRDLGSANGTFVNGVRILGERSLKRGDTVTIGNTAVILDVEVPSVRDETIGEDARPSVTPREFDVLQALCRPVFTSEVFSEPASVREIARTLIVTEAAVKQHLLRLYDKFGVEPGSGRRVRLANEAVRRGTVAAPQFRDPPREGNT